MDKHEALRLFNRKFDNESALKLEDLLEIVSAKIEGAEMAIVIISLNQKNNY